MQLIISKSQASKSPSKSKDKHYAPSDRSNSSKRLPNVSQDLSSNDERQDKPESKSIKIEPVQLPKKDPHPVKVNHNFLIETSFEDKLSEHSEEDLIGYHNTKFAVKYKRSTQSVDSNINKRIDDNMMNEMRKNAKVAEFNRIKGMNKQHFHDGALMKFSGALSKIKMINIMRNFVKKEPKKSDGKLSTRRVPDMNYINKLYEGDSKKQFQKKGIIF
jgi:hypothetical protein